MTAIVTAGWTEVVRLLIARGADVNKGRPLEYALDGHEEIAAMIRQAGGTARPLRVLRRERERNLREMKRYFEETEAARRATYPPEDRDRTLTEDDHQVIETVLLDLLASKDPDLFLGNRDSPDIILIDRTARWSGFLSDDQMNGELDDKQANDVSLEIREHLVRRNAEPISLAGFTPASQHIRVAWCDQFRSGHPGTAGP